MFGVGMTGKTVFRRVIFPPLKIVLFAVQNYPNVKVNQTQTKIKGKS